DSSDVATVIEALADAEWSTDRVGMYGLSFPGWSQMLALASDDAPSLKAVVPVSPVTDLWSLFTEQGATLEILEFRPPLFTAQLVTGARSARANETGRPFVPDTEPGHVACPRYSEEIETSPPVWNGDRTAYFQERDLRPLIDGTKVAVFATVGLRWDEGDPTGETWDLMVDQLDGVWDLLGPHRRFMLGQWAHGFPTRPDFDQMAVAWLDRYLRTYDRDDPGAIKPGVVEYEDDSGVWHTAKRWPPRATDATLWLSGDDLVADPGDVEASSRTFLSSDRVPCAGVCMRPFAGRLPGCVGDHLVYVSEPLTEEVVIAGHYTVDLTIESDLPDGTLASFLYHTDADDPCAVADHTESGQAIADLRHVFVDEGADFPVNTPTDITLTSVPLASRIPAGHRLVLTVGSAGWNTVPDPYRPHLTVTTGPGTVSALTLPVVEGTFATTS
ncbi:MAG: CocE/NonD family hydrolase, partial [Actinobacteria bacterium]|nr:CocE/NonD family hydrolase [Actinomycetota bacterium]